MKKRQHIPFNNLKESNSCPTCGQPVQNCCSPEQAAKDLLTGINKGLSGRKLLNFARRKLALWHT